MTRATSEPERKEHEAPRRIPERSEVVDRYKWDVAAVYPDWAAWQADLDRLSSQIDEYATLQGTLAQGPDALLKALQLADDAGARSYKVWYYAALIFDQDQRDNAVNARRQQVQILFARWQQQSAWFNPELLAIPLETVRGWMAAREDLALYRFALEDLYRQQEHVLDREGERLLALASRLSGAPADAFAAISTADIKFPTITLADGHQVELSYGQYRALLASNRHQVDRATAFRALHQVYRDNVNTYAALYGGVLQRDWFHARARRYQTTLDAALHHNDIPASVVDRLIESTRAGVEPLRRYHRLRQRVLGLERYASYDGQIPLVELDRRYPYDDVLAWIVEASAPLGEEYQGLLRKAVGQGWIDVYENTGKRSGAYSAPVYGVHPYVLMNYNETLDAVFTLAHELGHSMHTMLAHSSQPFVYAGYTIFVAEVASTLSEALFLDYMLSHTNNEVERIVLLQHAIDEMVGTFYTQVMFADFERQAHELVERGQPITAEGLSELYRGVLDAYLGDAVSREELSAVTWARIPHFYQSPYYVYQYATCYASTARLMEGLRADDPAERRATVDRYLALLRSGGSDHPMNQLRAAGVDLREPGPIVSVVEHFDRRVSQLEAAIDARAAKVDE